MYPACVRGVFRLVTGIYALGTLIRLLQRRSGAATDSPIPTASVEQAVVARVAPDAKLPVQPIAEQRNDPHALNADERNVSDSDHGQEPTLGEPNRAKDATIEHLPRERLFEMARAGGHRLEDLITMSRDDLIDAIAPANVEQKDHSPVNSSDHDKITNWLPPLG